MIQPGKRTTAVLLAAGKGTRMRSTQPKVLHRVLGKPLVVHVIEAALSAGCDDVVVVVGHEANSVEAEVGAWLREAPVRFALQREQRGTGHAVLCAAEHLAESDAFFVLSGDVPGTSTAILQRLAAAAASSSSPVAFVTCELSDPTSYGRVTRDSAGHVMAIVEHRDATGDQLSIREINTGIYYLAREFALDTLRRSGTNNAQGEVYLTDVVRAAAEASAPAATVEVADGPEVWGINDRADLARVQTALGDAHKAAWMREGVTMDDPRSIWLDSTVELSADVHLGRSVRLQGRTRVAAGARIDDGTIITDSDIAKGAHIKPYCVLDASIVGEAAVVGPFAHLRPGTALGARAKIGNFVETKKAQLGAGAKASHLSYLGDCTVGAGANVGAGTITCNYDGTSKWPTRIGEGAFIGSGTQLVAPVNVGDGAYVGAGSTITETVPAGALGVARGRQRNIEGWVENRAPKRTDGADAPTRSKGEG